MRKLLLCNADVHTMADPPRCTTVLVADQHVVAVGDRDLVAEHASGAEVLDCRGRGIVPAFIDPHVHLLALAAALRSIDCSPAAAPDIPSLLERIRERAEGAPAGVLLQAIGYRESELAERRHPTRWELDAGTNGRPLRLRHGSGHASILNSAAMALAGIATDTEAPARGEIGRRTGDGEPDGLFLELERWLDDRLPGMPAAELEQGVRAAGQLFRDAGVAVVQDLGEHNDPDTATLLEGFRSSGVLTVAFDVAFGIAAFRADRRLGAAGRLLKLVVRDLGGLLDPELDTLTAAIAEIDAAGGRAAVHAVTEAAVSHTIQAFERAGGQRALASGHRIEHASISPPPLAERIAQLGLRVVSNPSFLYESGDRYLREVAPADLQYLYDMHGLRRRGVLIAAASDAPYSTPNPLRSIAAAVRRTSRSGVPIPGRGLSLRAALAAHTTGAAAAMLLRRADAPRAGRGRISPGLQADLVILSAPLSDVLSSDVRVEATMYAGEWHAEPRW